MEKRKVILTNQKGFTLIEVMIAIAIFSIFATVFVTGQGYNLLDSSKLKEDILLKDLCENTINEVITNPPELKDSLTISKETKDFEKNPNYSYTIEYQKFFVPDMSKIAAKEDEKDDNSQKDLEKRLYAVFKENMEKILTQFQSIFLFLVVIVRVLSFNPLCFDFNLD